MTNLENLDTPTLLAVKRMAELDASLIYLAQSCYLEYHDRASDFMHQVMAYLMNNFSFKLVHDYQGNIDVDMRSDYFKPPMRLLMNVSLTLHKDAIRLLVHDPKTGASKYANSVNEAKELLCDIIQEALNSGAISYANQS